MDSFDLGQLDSLITQERIDTALAFALNLIYVAAIAIATFVVAGWLRRRITALAARHPRLDPTLFGFLGNLVKYFVLAMGAIFVLNRFGIQTASLVAVIGAAGLAIGLALQGTLSNLAAGVMIVLFRPFRVGQYIEAGDCTGTVVEIALFYTELRTYDGLQIIVPNGDIWSSSIKNYSANETRMIDLQLGVSYDTDLRRARAALERIAASDPRILAEPAPFIKVKELGDSSVDFVFRVWSKSSDWWALKCDLTEEIKGEFDANEIGIPFPTRTLVVEGNGKSGSDKAGGAIPEPKMN